MQRYRLVQYFDYHVDTVVYAIMDAEEPLYDMQELDNVSANKPISNKDLGDKVLIKNEWCVHGQIPKVAQKIIRPEMLTFIEDSVWDRKALVYSTKIIPHHLKNQINVRHKAEYFDNGDGRTKRIVSGFLEIKIPVIGGIIEAAFINYIKQNAEQDYKITQKAMDKFILEKGDPNKEKSFKKL